LARTSNTAMIPRKPLRFLVTRMVGAERVRPMVVDERTVRHKWRQCCSMGCDSKNLEQAFCLNGSSCMAFRRAISPCRPGSSVFTC
jgi:hypothetical protein